MAGSKSIKNLRLLHRYMGLFFSPAILFFAFSGGLQVFNLHKSDKSTGYDARNASKDVYVEKPLTTRLRQ
jgi:hypothetical protein